MAFGKKAAVTSFDPQDATHLAQEALRKRRATVARIAIRVTFEELLMNHFSNKALLKMLGKMVGIVQPKEHKDLTESFEDSIYRNAIGEIVVPCRLLKATIVNGAIATGGAVSKAELKRDLRVVGYTSPLRFEGIPEMDIAIVKNDSGVPDVRARARIPAGATADFVLTFPTSLSPDKVMSALEGAGTSIGVFDWRIERGGSFGGFRVDVLPQEEADRVIEETKHAEVQYDIPPGYLRAFNSEKKGDALKKAQALIEHVNGQPRPAMKKRRSAQANAGE